MKNRNNPMQLFESPRCTAHSKRTNQPCRNPAVRGWAVCRMHGAGGGAPIKTGLHTNEAKRLKAEIAELIRSSNEMLDALM